MPKHLLLAILFFLMVIALFYQSTRDNTSSNDRSYPTISAVVDHVETTQSRTQTASTEKDLQVHAQQLADQFIGTLKPILIKQLKNSGPVSAITVCQSEAPAIAANLSEQSGWYVKRVSLKPRNISHATPDHWESAVLAGFNQQLQSNDIVLPLEASAVQSEQYRFMRAQLVEPPCLICHGEKIAPEVQAALDQHYPDDHATGYKLGEVRGAISLRKVFN